MLLIFFHEIFSVKIREKFAGMLKQINSRENAVNERFDIISYFFYRVFIVLEDIVLWNLCFISIIYNLYEKF